MARQIIGARSIPQRTVEIDKLKFQIITYDKDHGDHLEVSDGDKRIIIDPREQGIPKNKDRFGIVQILPFEDRIRIYASTYAKPGALLSYDFFKDRFKLEFRKKLDTCFWTFGLLGDRNEKGIAIGAGDEIGIRFFDLSKGTLDEVVSNKEKTERELSYSFYILFQNPPQMQDGKFYISHLDSQGDFLCHDNTFGTALTGQIVRDIRRRLKDPKLDRVLEICIDDEMIKRGYENELISIKQDVASSYFLYNICKQPPSQVIMISEGVSDYIRKQHLELE